MFWNVKYALLSLSNETRAYSPLRYKEDWRLSQNFLENSKTAINMRSLSILTIVTIAIFLQGAIAAPVESTAVKAPNVIGLDFELHVKAANGTLIKRAEYPAPLTNENYYYITYLNFGSNGQKIGVDVDTGSSDLWVPDALLSGQKAAEYGLYDPSQSTSAKDLGKQFSIGYVDGSQTSGDFYSDSVSFDGITLENFQFADATQVLSTSVSGILGIAPVAGESELASEGSYPNFPNALKNAGYISKVGYSLYLGAPGSNVGSFLFGGKDLAKIDGTVATLPHAGDPTRLSVTLNSISTLGQTYNSGNAYVLDSGTTSALFELSLYNAILQELGSTGQSDFQNNAIVNCDQTGNFDFNFEGVTIHVPKSDFVINGGWGECVTNIIENDQYSILGDLFLRRAYILYDLENLSIQLSNVKYTTDTNIVSL